MGERKTYPGGIYETYRKFNFGGVSRSCGLVRGSGMASNTAASVRAGDPGNGDGVYLLSYYDVSTGFDASAGGYGGAGSSGGVGDALLRIVNAGNFEVATGGCSGHRIDKLPRSGDVCANIYVFNDIQEMEECCQCNLSANSLRTISVINDLLKNPFTGSESTEAGVIKILGVRPLTQGPPSVCNHSTTVPLRLADGLHAWVNHTEQMGISAPPFGFVTSTSVEGSQFPVLTWVNLSNSSPNANSSTCTAPGEESALAGSVTEPIPCV